MTMKFREIKAAIATVLANAAAGRYRVRGFPELNLDAAALDDTDRVVQVFYRTGEFPKSSSGRGPFDHQMTFRVFCAASASASVDLTVLDNPASTPTQIATALAAAEPAEQVADDSFDELADAVFQALMAGDQLDFGLSYPIGSRWLGEIQKNDAYSRGDRVVVSGYMDVTCRAPEEVASTTKQDVEVIDNSLQVVGDDVTRAGVEADY